ncbi:GCN5 family acetyltransferase [Bacillus sp. FJAT-18017]|uniref:GNAT family N-acetyltransferase n=1 Tax=Bacillus sp. FJAT-18017 TaxID=1705566 RepID=UPI0006AE3BB9|nr:GNAT family protein [Bacillus sp. FJAT-18017]ALC90361.1 GCN5 family acetyltransferase [Bacillus sp. FJAT-18017]
MKIGQKVTIKPITPEELPLLWEMIYGEEEPEWKKWDAPYFPLKRIEKEEYIISLNILIEEGLNTRWSIWADGKLIGTVSYYWEHKPSLWLEAGIVIYDPAYWNGGYGTEAFKLWIDQLFATMAIHRIGCTTWSGNKRMIKVGEKLGMTMEARIRKARIYNGEFFDSIKMGILKEEWEEIHNMKKTL